MKHKYEEIVKKHGLPDVRAFIPMDDELTLTDVRKAIADKLYGFVDTLDMLLHPEGISSMVEAQTFTELEHEQVRKLYQRLMLLGKDCHLADIYATETEDVQLIKSLMTQWPEIVKEMKLIVQKTKDAYSGKAQGGLPLSYLG